MIEQLTAAGIRWVVCDIGETIVDDTRELGRWAQWLGVPMHTMSGLAALTGSWPKAFNLIRPGIDLPTEYRRRAAAGCGEHIQECDLYPDVRPALTALRAAGFHVAIVGNQTAQVGPQLRALNLPADWIATSDEWEVRKPDPVFFAHIAELADAKPHQVVYVGDQLHKDITPARAFGFAAIHIRRGPYGWLLADDPAVREHADWRITSLTELAGTVQP
jgi:HAD superfamily hydrolase (TIGR01662 family)